MSSNYKDLKEKYNFKLKTYNQTSYIKFLDSDSITFSNNKKFYGKERKKWIKRINDCKNILQNFDNIINDITRIEDLRRELCSQAGKKSWDKSREKIISKMKGRVPPNKGKFGKDNPLYGRTISDETKAKISERNRGQNNGMYGKKRSEEDKKIQSQKIKDLILKGLFTPNTNNRLTHWESKLDNVSYRSSWECLYKYHNPDSIHEKLRIKYTLNGEEKIFIVDFIDEKNKLAIEVKPNNILKQRKSQEKIKSLSNWCKNNDYTMIIVNEDWIIKNIKEDFIDYNRFDEKTQSKIKKFYEVNTKNRNRQT